ncbi:MAG: cupin domain-containing protein [Bacteroidia bacterium]
MEITYPYTIDNGSGEQLTFLRLVEENGSEPWLEVENLVQPNSGPPMHIHFFQEEALTVVQGQVATQVLGHEPQFYGPGETCTFKARVPHKFWNAGTGPLICKGYIKPAHNVAYFLSKIYESTKENGGKMPDPFDAAYLMHRYRTEFDMLEIPPFVKRVIFPVTRFMGTLQGKHKKFADAPEPVREIGLRS